MRISKLILAILACCVLASLPAFADFTVIPVPTPAYTSSTTVYTPSVGNFNNFSSLGPFTFSTSLNQRTVPSGGWNTWNCPPATESCTPVVGYSNGATSLSIFDTPGEHTVGFELEPNPTSLQTFTATFLDNGTIVGSITLAVNGRGGALLFAATSTTDVFTQIDISGTSDFAIAQLRSGGPSAIPEPGAFLLLGSGLLGLVGRARKFLV